MNKRLYLSGALICCMLTQVSCSNEPSAPKNEDITDTIDKTGSIETVLSTNHIDKLHDEVVTTHKIWTNSNLYKTVVHRDTIPSLGQTTEEGENGNGDITSIKLQKDYEIYVTVQ
ncbi:hypothetical protein CLV59_108336 [Chitinophaga dinghuensis]|uniref:Uncharacterized protein n=1 Tax=Chitinophaga dinghuensis TaxID=1539050 RepID=A0A327VN97_9BACT|nr:hypothetical protein [Chitinophaga dinghuensis]RAJ76815.1 hypothetical protein CLV59_108336 [Chitinophaga dinghuensis]